MGVIFFLSAQPDLNSGLGVVDLIGRKIIHASEYALLCFLWWRALRSVLPERRAGRVLLGIAFSDARSHEFPPTFLSGRDGPPGGPAVDMIGAGSGAPSLTPRPG